MKILLVIFVTNEPRGYLVLNIIFYFALISCQSYYLELLIRDLGHKEFKVRQAATKKIKESMDFNVCLRLKKIDSSELEVVLRVKRLIKDYQNDMKEKYSIKITDYPEFPWIDRLPVGYEWNGLTKHDIFNKYWWKSSRLDREQIWYFPRCRRAAKLWLNERISNDFKDAWENSRNDKEFTGKMDSAVKSIRNDIMVLIQGEDKYYSSQGKENPVRKRMDSAVPRVEITY